MTYVHLFSLLLDGSADVKIIEQDEKELLETIEIIVSIINNDINKGLLSTAVHSDYEQIFTRIYKGSDNKYVKKRVLTALYETNINITEELFIFHIVMDTIALLKTLKEEEDLNAIKRHTIETYLTELYKYRTHEMNMNVLRNIKKFLISMRSLLLETNNINAVIRELEQIAIIK